MNEDVREIICGSHKLIDWFGRWPTFHDHEVLSVNMDRVGPTILMRIHSWEMTDEVDEKGFIKLRKHAIVTLKWKGVKKLTLNEFNKQNVLFEIQFRKDEDGIHTVLDASVGLWGEITASEVEVVSVDKRA